MNCQIDEITRTFREMDNLESGNDGLTAEHQSAAANINLMSTKALLAVQHKNLNPSFEMKRMFGSKVVQTKQ